MKKNFKKLVLNKSTLSNLESKEVVGGATSNLISGCATQCGASCGDIVKKIKSTIYAIKQTCHKNY